jgi:hypothetical protein
MHLQFLSIAALLASALPALAADPLTELVPMRSGASVCFQRSYDAAHLKQHPRQTIRSVLLSLRRESKRPDNLVLRISFEDKRRPETALVGGWCGWRQSGVNRGEHTPPRLVPSFPKEAGLQCQGLPFWGVSGEDASLFPINLDSGGRWLTAYMRESVSVWTGAFAPEPPVLRLGTDDRVFRLERVDASTCAVLERAIPDPSRPD